MVNSLNALKPNGVVKPHHSTVVLSISILEFLLNDSPSSRYRIRTVVLLQQILKLHELLIVVFHIRRILNS